MSDIAENTSRIRVAREELAGVVPDGFIGTAEVGVRVRPTDSARTELHRLALAARNDGSAIVTVPTASLLAAVSS